MVVKRRSPRAVFIICAALASLTAAETKADDHPRINQIQVLGTHNSYKQAIDPSLLQILRSTRGERMQTLEYSHRTVPEQLDAGLRSLEIDVLHDPEGGRYAQPRGIEM